MYAPRRPAGDRGRARAAARDPVQVSWQGLTSSIIATNIIHFIHETFACHYAVIIHY